jgi:hypothetical protein
MRKQTIIVSVMVVAVVCLVLAQPNATQTRSTISTQAANGRWQIVNGTPEMSRNIMLLDTQTGDSWIVCSDSKGVTYWCSLSRGFEQVGNTQPKDAPGLNQDKPGLNQDGPAMPKCLHYDKSGLFCTEYEKP